MAHPLNDRINMLEKRSAVKCNKNCEYFKFKHLRCACVLSDVFSVNQGEPCFEFKKRMVNEKLEK